VAAGLHVLVLQLWPHNNTLQLHTDEGSALQVSLIKNNMIKTELTKREKARTKPVAMVSTPAKRTVQQPPKVKVVTTASTQQAQKPDHEVATQQRETSHVAAKVAHEAAPESASSAAAIPADVEQMILTQISYPRQARRKGWQGKATFHLDVREQKLAQLDLFHSSGHHLLDRAAMRSIRAMDRLPLANGLYRLPVEFRLQ